MVNDSLYYLHYHYYYYFFYFAIYWKVFYSASEHKYVSIFIDHVKLVFILDWNRLMLDRQPDQMSILIQ